MNSATASDPSTPVSRVIEFVQIAALEHERSLDRVSPEDIQERRYLAHELLRLPEEVLSQLRHFQPQVGCLNACSFCSQAAGTEVWQLTPRSLSNVIAALKSASAARFVQLADRAGPPFHSPNVPILNSHGVFAPDFKMPPLGLIGYARKKRPGVIYCYLDDDPAAYPHLDLFCELLWRDLGARCRISTIGFNRRNEKLARIHTRIAKQLSHTVAGIRLSLSAYTPALATSPSKRYSRRQYVEDAAYFLRLYNPVLGKLGVGRKTFSIELRFRPNIECVANFRHAILGEAEVLCAGPYLIITPLIDADHCKASLCNPDNHKLEFNRPPKSCWIITAKEETVTETFNSIVAAKQEDTFSSLVQRFAADGRRANLLLTENDDGPYYVLDPSWTESGLFMKAIYPQNGKRPHAGIADCERYFANALISYRARKKSSEKYSWSDVLAVIAHLRTLAVERATWDQVGSKYVRTEVVPLVLAHAQILRKAGLPANAFFDRDFTIDTGPICNLGRAFFEFDAICSRPNLPVTPNHERAYGRISDLASEGTVWRISVASHVGDSIARVHNGIRNAITSLPALAVEELDLTLTSDERGQLCRRHLVPLDAAAVQYRKAQWAPTAAESPGIRSPSKSL